MDTTLQPELIEEHSPAVTPDPTFKETMISFWQYLKHPVYLPEQNIQAAQVWRPFLQILVANVIVALSLSFLASKLILLLGYDAKPRHEVAEMLKSMHPALAFLLIAIIGPAFEEFICRFPLRYTLLRFLLLLSIASFGCVPFVMDAFGDNIIVGLSFVLALAALIVCFLIFDSWKESVERLWIQYFGFIFYSVAILFALYHLTNFTNLNMPFYWMPLWVLPQLAGALFWGYTRMKYGLIWAIAAHGLYNGILVCMHYLGV